MTFVLDATNKTLKFSITAGAGADVHFTSHWADATTTGFTEGQTQGASNGSTAVDVVPAPVASTRRIVKLITFHNTNSTTSRTVTLVNDVGGTSRTIAVFTLAPLTTWYSDTAATTAIIDRDYGDITVSGSGATWTIDSGAVTLAKIQNIATSRLLGRSTSGSGIVEELTAGTGIITWLGTPSSANLFTALTTKTGTGGDVVFSTAPTMRDVTIETGNLTFSNAVGSGSAQLLRADMGNSDFTKRFYMQTISTASANSVIPVVPRSGSTGSSTILLFNNGNVSDLGSNYERLVLGYILDTGVLMDSQAIGTGTARSIQLRTQGTTRLHLETNGNIGFNGNSYGSSSVGVIFIANAATIPTGPNNPSGGGVLYATDGELWWRGSNGTTTKIANK